MIVAPNRGTQDEDVNGKVGRIRTTMARRVLPANRTRKSGRVQDLVERSRCECRLGSMELVGDLQRGREAVTFGHERYISYGMPMRYGTVGPGSL
jgi:hypothetical protein